MLPALGLPQKRIASMPSPHPPILQYLSRDYSLWGALLGLPETAENRPGKASAFMEATS